jgi:hypothetical protein
MAYGDEFDVINIRPSEVAMRVLRAIFFVPVVGLALLAGCGRDTAEAPPGPAPVVDATGKACDLVTLAEARSALGGAEIGVLNDSEDGCTYGTADNLRTVDVKVEQLEYRQDVVDLVKSSLEPSAVKPLDGVGDAAFSYQPVDGVTQNYAWGKGRFLQVSVSNDGARTADGARQLIQTAYGRL